MYRLIRSILFRLDPEWVHHRTIDLLRLFGGMPFLSGLVRSWFRSPDRPVLAFGLRFKNPVGLAAGYDKDGLAWRGLAALGFGHIEVGTVTLEPQSGNPPPRLFRLPEEKALINRLGFPSRGAEYVARRLVRRKPGDLILGVNLGKNKSTPLDSAAEDYLQLMRRFAGLADYLVVNVSSPNTVGLRRLQSRSTLEALLTAVYHERQVQQERLSRRIPVLVKLAPDLSKPELEDALDVIMRTNMDGVIATNTTVSREGVRSHLAEEVGGLSGAPLRARSTGMVRQVCALTAGKLPVIGVGGVMSAEDVQEKLDAGATLVQIYTGLVYRGPGLVKQVLSG